VDAALARAHDAAMPTVELFFDYASPWSYLADALAARRLPGVALTLRPIYLRGLESFATGLPYTQAKLAYIVRDFARCVAHEGVPYAPPPAFPINGVHALRGAIVAEREGALPRYHAAMFRAAWAEGRDVSQKDVVAAIARELELPAVAEAIDAPDVKAELKARTEAAVARGVFGVPTFFVGDEMFWGHDRLDYVARAAASV
jgi:2-hydroxychromene-2-carboxylate isomerase